MMVVGAAGRLWRLFLMDPENKSSQRPSGGTFVPRDWSKYNRCFMKWINNEEQITDIIIFPRLQLL